MQARTVALLAREAGLRVLVDSLLQNPAIELVCVATHRRLPRADDPNRGERPEFRELQRVCTERAVELVAVDDPTAARELAFLRQGAPIDLICSVSWRYILTKQALALARLGAINLHRGALPEFAGAEPVRRMLEAGCKEAVISAHLMVQEVDAGPVLATVRLPMDWDERTPIVEHAEVVKRELLSLYAPLMDLAIAACLARQGKLQPR